MHLCTSVLNVGDILLEQTFQPGGGSACLRDAQGILRVETDTLDSTELPVKLIVL